jgi:hypothetical protein
MRTPKASTEKPNLFLTKSDFGLKNKAHDWEDAPWSWIVRRGYLPIDSPLAEPHRNITLAMIEVNVWPRHHEPYDPNLDMRFPPTPAGLAEARSYARASIEAGGVLAEVRLSVNFPYKSGVLAQLETFRSDAPTPTDPRDM